MSRNKKRKNNAPSSEGVFGSGVADVFGGGAWLITEDGRKQVEAAAQLLSSFDAAAQVVEVNQPKAAGPGVIAVTGPLTRHTNIISQYMGWATLDEIKAQVEAMDADDSINRITMYFDTPGGTVFGLPEAASAIADCKTAIVAFSSGLCASAGYWLASQCDAIYTGRIGTLGSIGIKTYVEEPDVSVVVSSNAPKKVSSREDAQAFADDIEAVMFETIASGRGVSVDHVKKHYGQGGVFVGQSAVDAGLADEVTTIEQVITGVVGISPAQAATTSETGEPMTTENKTGGEATANQDDAIAQARAEGIEAGKKQAQAEAKAEAERVSAIQDAGKGKAQEQVQAMIDSGLDAEAAAMILKASPDVKPEAPNKLEAQMSGTNPTITNDTNASTETDEDKEESSQYLAGANAAIQEMN